MMIVPKPKTLEWKEGVYSFGNRVTLQVNHAFPANKAERLRILWNRFSMTGSTLSIEQNAQLPAFCGRIGEGNIPALNAEDEYAIEATPAGVGLAAKDETGLMHAFFSLIQVIEPVNLKCGEEQLEIPAFTAHDHPSMAFRSVHVCVFPETSLLLLEKTFSMAGLLKCSHIVLEFWGTLQYDALPEMAWAGRSYSKHQIRPLIELANSFGMEVISMTNHLGHASQSRFWAGKHTVLDQNPRLATLFEPDGWTWCLSNPEVHTLLRRFREELIELCGEGKYFHLGCDEADSYATCRRCAGKDKVAMLADYLNGLAAELDEVGRRGIIWHDMFLESSWRKKTPSYVANSTPEKMTHLALPRLDRRLIMADWEYDIMEGEVASAAYFKEQGFTTILCPWDGGGYKNTLCLAHAVEKQGLDGIMITTWHHLPDMNKELPNHLSAAWNGCGFTSLEDWHWGSTPTLLRKLMAKPSRFEDSGFASWEVDSKYTVNP